MALDVSGIKTRHEALLVAYEANKDNKLTQEDWDYLLGKWGIVEEDLDEIVYEDIDDEDIEDAQKDGKKAGQKENIDNWAEAGTGAAMTGMSVGFNIAGTGAISGGKGLIGRLLKGTSGKGGGGGALAIMALAASLAAAIVHLVSATNGKKEELEGLNKTLEEATSDMQESQENMGEATRKIYELQVAATKANSEGEAKIIKMTTDAAKNDIEYNRLLQKMANGETLTDFEQSWFDAEKAKREVIDTKIQQLSDGIVSDVSGASEQILTLQGSYDEFEETTLAHTETITYTAQVAKGTTNAAKTNIIAAIANIASAALAAARMWIQAPFNWVVNAVGTAIAVGVGIMEGIAISKEKKNIEVAGTVAANSEGTANVNAQTIEVLNQNKIQGEMAGSEVDELDHKKTNPGQFSN